MGGCFQIPEALNIAEVYDPETDRWVYIAPMLAGRYWFGTGVINGEIYAVGGVSYDGVKLNAVERYNPEKDNWTRVASMNSSRYGHGVCVLDNVLYVVGGASSYNYLYSCEKYDAETDTWSAIARMHCARSFAGVFADNGLIYVVGGARFMTAVKIEVYCPKRNSWEKQPWTSLAWNMKKQAQTCTMCMIECVGRIG